MPFEKGNKWGAKSSKPTKFQHKLSQPSITDAQRKLLDRIKIKHNFKTDTQALRHVLDWYQKLSEELK